MERLSYKVNGLNILLIKTTKFKTTDILLNFRNYLNNESVTKRALVPFILKAATEKYPNKKLINRQLEKLFGASFGVNINKQGLQQILSFRMSLVNETYITNNLNLFEEAFKLLNEIIFNPKTIKGVFDEEIVNTEKRLLREHFVSLYDDKIRYSYDKLIDSMCKNESYKIKSIGKAEDIDSLTPKNLYETYLNIIDEDTVDLFVIGDIDIEKTKSLIERYIQFEERDEVLNVIDKEEKEITKFDEVIERQQINQGKLNIGFRTYTRGSDKDYYALLVMNGILGSYPHSLLFRNVREKNSLCYYISSTIDKAKGLLIVYAGIENDDYQKALSLTLEQLKLIQNGEIEAEILENTKKALINDLLEMQDSAYSILANEYSSLLFNEISDVNNKISKINAITIDDVVKVSQKIKGDTVYFLTGEEVNK